MANGAGAGNGEKQSEIQPQVKATTDEENKDDGIRTLQDEQGLEEGTDQVNQEPSRKGTKGTCCCGLCVLPWKRRWKKLDKKRRENEDAVAVSNVAFDMDNEIDGQNGQIDRNHQKVEFNDNSNNNNNNNNNKVNLYSAPKRMSL